MDNRTWANSVQAGWLIRLKLYADRLAAASQKSLRLAIPSSDTHCNDQVQGIPQIIVFYFPVPAITS